MNPEANPSSGQLDVLHVFETSLPIHCLRRVLWATLDSNSQRAFRNVCKAARKLVDQDMLSFVSMDKLGHSVEVPEMVRFLEQTNNLRKLKLGPYEPRLSIANTAMMELFEVVRMSPKLARALSGVEGVDFHPSSWDDTDTDRFAMEDAVMEGLVSCFPALKQLSLMLISTSTASLQLLSSCKHLRKLHLGHVNVAGQDLGPAISGMTQLHELNIFALESSAFPLDSLQHWTSLQTLALSNVEVRQPDALAALTGLTNLCLRDLKVSGAAPVQLSFLQQLQQLQHFEVSNMEVAAGSFRHIEQLQHLTSLSFGPWVAGDGLQLVWQHGRQPSMSALQQLELTTCLDIHDLHYLLHTACNLQVLRWWGRIELSLQENDDLAAAAQCLREVAEKMASLPAVHSLWGGCGDRLELGLARSLQPSRDPLLLPSILGSLAPLRGRPLQLHLSRFESFDARAAEVLMTAAPHLALLNLYGVGKLERGCLRPLAQMENLNRVEVLMSGSAEGFAEDVVEFAASAAHVAVKILCCRWWKEGHEERLKAACADGRIP